MGATRLMNASGKAAFASHTEKKAKYRITFVAFTELVKGAGAEHFILNVLKHIPDDFSATVIQTDLATNVHLPSSYVKEVLGTSDATLITVKRDPLPLSWDRGFLFILKRSIGPLLQGFLNRPVLRGVNSDIIYLTRNDDVLWVPKKPIIIGSTIAQVLSARRHRLGRLYRRVKYRNIQAFHFTCRKLMDEAVVRTLHDFIIPLGVDTRLFYPMASETGRTVRFLFVGRLEASKGIDILMEAWKIVREKAHDVELHIAGSGSLKGMVRNEASVTYHESAYQGGTGEDDLGALYRNCDIFVFPSVHETFGLVVLEALASGLFVITTPALRGIFDVFAEKYEMLEFVEREPAEFAAAMLRAYANINGIKSRKIIVSNFARSNYDWETISRQFFASVRHLLAAIG